MELVFKLSLICEFSQDLCTLIVHDFQSFPLTPIENIYSSLLVLQGIISARKPDMCSISETAICCAEFLLRLDFRNCIGAIRYKIHKTTCSV